jgi:hypothetical protein
MARMVLDHDESCESCEQTLSPHQGPAVARRYEFPVREVALALVRVGRGMSYTEVAERSRPQTRRGNLVSAQLVGNWVEVFGPVVAAAHAVTTWPATVVLDSTPFYAELPIVGKGRVFSVLCATGYAAGDMDSSVVELRAVTRTNKATWGRLAASRPGTPRLVICDEDPTLLSVFPGSWPTTALRLCRWHLTQRLRSQLLRFGVDPYGTNPLAVAAHGCLDDLASWRRFRSAVKKHGGAELANWAANHDGYLTTEFAAGPLPAHRSNGSAEAAIREVRDVLERRAFCFRNAERTNRLLELVRLRLNKVDDAGHYAAKIRQYLDAGGRLTPQGCREGHLGAAEPASLTGVYLPSITWEP